MLVVLLVILGILAAVAVYGWIEAGWLRERVLEVPLDGLPEALDGIRIGHLSDFHLGAPLSRGNRASERAARWVSERRPDLVCITGDLVSHPRGEPRLRALVASPRPSVRRARQPRRRRHARSRHVVGSQPRLRHPPVLPRGRAPRSRAGETARGRGGSRHAARRDRLGRRRRPGDLSGQASAAARARRTAGRRYACCSVTFRESSSAIPGASFDLILAGHLHAGQICLPLPRRRVTLAHPRAELVSGLYRTSAGTMHVSPGTGTTFVPFRFFARPEVTELVLRRRD